MSLRGPSSDGNSPGMIGSVRGLVVSVTCWMGFWVVDWTVSVAVSVTLLMGRPRPRPLVTGSRDIVEESGRYN